MKQATTTAIEYATHSDNCTCQACKTSQLKFYIGGHIEIVKASSEAEGYKIARARMIERIGITRTNVLCSRTSVKTINDRPFARVDELSKQPIGTLRIALAACVSAMEIQEQRETEAFHLSADAFRPIWDKALANARAVLSTNAPTKGE